MLRAITAYRCCARVVLCIRNDGNSYAKVYDGHGVFGVHYYAAWCWVARIGKPKRKVYLNIYKGDPIVTLS